MKLLNYISPECGVLLRFATLWRGFSCAGVDWFAARNRPRQVLKWFPLITWQFVVLIHYPVSFVLSSGQSTPSDFCGIRLHVHIFFVSIFKSIGIASIFTHPSTFARWARLTFHKHFIETDILLDSAVGDANFTRFLGDLRSLVRFVSFWKKRAKSEWAKSNHL